MLIIHDIIRHFSALIFKIWYLGLKRSNQIKKNYKKYYSALSQNPGLEIIKMLTSS